MKICICGGGSLGTVCAAVMGSQPDVEVSLLTGRPAAWAGEVSAADPEGRVYTARLAAVSDRAEEVVPGADLVFLCQPGYLIEGTLRAVRPHLGGATVGAVVGSTGFFFAAHDILPPGTPLFAFQRTPFIARLAEYGRRGLLLGYKPAVALAQENAPDPEALRRNVERLFRTPATLLDNFYEAALTNSNPILHTGRLYAMWHGREREPQPRPSLFYAEWTDEASQTIIDMDAEFMTLLRRLPVRPGAIPPLLQYYESTDAASLTRKLRSIGAFSRILSPMRQEGGVWLPDFASRYFTEDFPYGLRFIHRLLHEHGLAAPVTDRVFDWGMEVAEVKR